MAEQAVPSWCSRFGRFEGVFRGRGDGDGVFGTWLAVKKRGAFSDKEAREVESCGELQDVLRHQVDTGMPGVGDVLLNFNWYRPVEES